MSDIKAVWKLERWPIENLIPYELNVKKHDKEQIARLVTSIRRRGMFDQPIVVDKHGVIIKGHGRRLAAIELGMKEVPVVVRHDLNPEQVKAERLADNRVAISDIDTDMLKIELMELDDSELEGIFDAKELNFVKADLGTMNTDVFVTDMDAVVTNQKADIEQRTEAAVATSVTLAKAFGFKDMPAAGQIHITRLMARAEAATGLKNGEALAAFAAAME
jgi:hypothetical protein